MRTLYTGESIYKNKFNDQKAIYLSPIKDDATKYLQDAIDKIALNEKNGIIFLSEGNYYISETLFIYAGIRIIGYGNKRPTIVLKNNTFINETKFMIHFRSGLYGNMESRDANPGTFYSGLCNINLDAGRGNIACQMVRSFFAQHSIIEHVDFNINDAICGVGQVGNVMDNCRFFDGKFAIDTGKPSPSWPFLLTDSYFEGQKEAAIQTFECGLTMLGVSIKNTKVGIKVTDKHVEKLYTKNCFFENLDVLLQMNDVTNPRMYATIDNSYFNDINKLLTEANKDFLVSNVKNGMINLTYGLIIDNPYLENKMELEYEILENKKLDRKTSIPLFTSNLVNVLENGVKGDGETDDSDNIQELINEYDNLYFPSGRYKITKPLILKKHTGLYGLNPITTQIGIDDGTLEFQGGAVKGLIKCLPNNEYNVISGIGLDTGGNNSQACALDWQVFNGYLNDIKIIGGHGTFTVNGQRIPLYNETRSSDPNPVRKWNSQYPSIIIRNNGGGFFKNIWSASTFAKTGILIENTHNEIHFAGVSLEHHISNELIIRNASNVYFYDLQFEIEHLGGKDSLPLLIENCNKLFFANLYLYRVIWNNTPFRNGIIVRNSNDIKIYGLHNYAACKYTFDNSLFLEDHNIEIREREIAKLIIDNKLTNHKINNVKYEILKSGFEFVQSLTADNLGNLYFIEERLAILYYYNPINNSLKSRHLCNISPRCIICDQNNEIYAIDNKGQCFYLKGIADDVLELISLQDIVPSCQFVFPRNLWRDGHDFLQVVTKNNNQGYLLNDKKTMIVYFSDLHRCYGLRKGEQQFIMSDEFSQRTYSLQVEGPNLTNPILLKELGEFDAILEDNLYILEGDLYVIDNHNTTRINLPSRPSSIVKLNNTIYILTRNHLLKII